MALAGGGIPLDIQPQSIDVGVEATNRASYAVLYATIGNVYKTWINYGNAANATGTIDTVEIWLAYTDGAANVRAGSFSLGEGTTFTCRDGQNLGVLASGSKRTVSSLSIDFNPGDYIGTDCTGADDSGTVAVEASASGGDGVYSATGQFCDASDSASFILSAGDILSLYGTGTEAGTNYTKISSGDKVWFYETKYHRKSIGKLISDALRFYETKYKARVFNKSKSETLGLIESKYKARILNKIKGETLGLGETKYKAQSFRKTVADTIGFIESKYKSIGKLFRITDSVYLRETTKRIKGLFRRVSEPLYLRASQVSSKGFIRIKGESVFLRENIRKIPNFLTYVINHTVGLIEGIVKKRTLSRISDESVELGETNQGIRGAVRWISETLEISHTTETFKHAFHIIAETLEMNEISNIARNFIKRIAETIGLQDSLQWFRTAIKKIINEVVEVGQETIYWWRHLIPKINETLGLNESLVKARNLRKLISERVGLVEHRQASHALKFVIDELVGIAERWWKSLPLIKRALTLWPRVFAFTVSSRTFALTVKPRSFALALSARNFALTVWKRVFSFTLSNRS
jgi:hypothetical protein